MWQRGRVLMLLQLLRRRRVVMLLLEGVSAQTLLATLWSMDSGVGVAGALN
jgi:hypothetical protein